MPGRRGSVKKSMKDIVTRLDGPEKDYVSLPFQGTELKGKFITRPNEQGTGFYDDRVFPKHGKQ